MLYSSAYQIFLKDPAMQITHSPVYWFDTASSTYTYILIDADSREAIIIDPVMGGCGRTDFQSGSAQALHHSISSILFSLPDSTVMLPGHDYNLQTAVPLHGRKVQMPASRRTVNCAVWNPLCNA